MFQAEPSGSPVVKRHPCLEGWRRRVDEAEKRGAFTDDEKHLACRWGACAVGEARRLGYEIDMRPNNVGPIDDGLRTLGCYFHRCVRDHAFGEGRDTLAAIENRLAELGY